MTQNRSLLGSVHARIKMLKTVAILSNDELHMTLCKRNTYDLNTVNLFYTCTCTNLIIIDDKHKRYICVTQIHFRAFFRLACLAPTKTEFTWFKGEVHAHVRHKYSTWNKHTSLCDDWCSHSFSRKKLRNNIRRFRNRLIPKWRRVSLLLVLKLELYQKCNFIDNLSMPQLT